MAEFKFPKALGACADKLFELRNKRLEMQKAVDLVAKEESALKTHIIDNLPKSQASGVAGKLARVSITSKEIPQVKDWTVFYEYVRKTKQFDLMQRRLSDGAVKDRLDEGINIPGVELFNAVSVSINKL
jgi:hypothetical protein